MAYWNSRCWMSKGAAFISLAMLALASFVATQASSAAVTTRVSVSSTGAQANGPSAGAFISGDGRFVAFTSSATNLVPGDTNCFSDVFVHDRQTGLTSRVNVSTAGQQGNENSTLPSLTTSAISADGRYVLFSSQASNLIDGKTIEGGGLFVHDRQTGVTERIPASMTSAASISPDGRFIAFRSADSHLVPGDLNDVPDIFVYDRQKGRFARVSVSSAGVEANAEEPKAMTRPSGFGFFPFIGISNEGRHLCFVSRATNLVPGHTNYGLAIFVHDRQTGRTTRVSDPAGAEMCAISADGRFVAFVSMATNLVPGDTNDTPDIFVHDRETGMTSRVSVSSGGEQAKATSRSPSISADGRYVAFDSGALNLVLGDTNRAVDVFVHDRQTGQTTRVSISSSGEEGDDISAGPSISADGRFIAFGSSAFNLVAGDTNGWGDIFVHDRLGNAEGSASHVEGPPMSLQSSETPCRENGRAEMPPLPEGPAPLPATGLPPGGPLGMPYKWQLIRVLPGQGGIVKRSGCSPPSCPPEAGLDVAFTLKGSASLDDLRLLIDGNDVTAEARLTLERSRDGHKLNGSLVYENLTSLPLGRHVASVEPTIDGKKAMPFTWTFEIKE